MPMTAEDAKLLATAIKDALAPPVPSQAEAQLREILEDPIAALEQHKAECHEPGCRVAAYEKDLVTKGVEAYIAEQAAKAPKPVVLKW
jgi:hypothetical protein